MRRFLTVVLALPLLGWQLPPQFPGPEEPKRMPDGRLQSEVILKAEHEKNLEELGKIDALLAGVARELTAGTPGRSNAQLSKDLEEVEKLARRVRNRMTKY
jgi:hypothetical protein